MILLESYDLDLIGVFISFTMHSLFKISTSLTASTDWHIRLLSFCSCHLLWQLKKNTALFIAYC